VHNVQQWPHPAGLVTACDWKGTLARHIMCCVLPMHCCSCTAIYNCHQGTYTDPTRYTGWSCMRLAQWAFGSTPSNIQHACKKQGSARKWAVRRTFAAHQHGLCLQYMVEDVKVPAVPAAGRMQLMLTVLPKPHQLPYHGKSWQPQYQLQHVAGACCFKPLPLLELEVGLVTVQPFILQPTALLPAPWQHSTCTACILSAPKPLPRPCSCICKGSKHVCTLYRLVRYQPTSTTVVP
jgi:hypothetical protein